MPDLSLLPLSVLALAAFCAGALNAIAGGGTFLTFPALVWTGVPPIIANATSAFAVCPGYLGSVMGFRAELAALPRSLLWREVGLSAVGGVAGAMLLLVTPAQTFAGIVPWLLLFATVLFAIAPRLVRWSGYLLSARGPRSLRPPTGQQDPQTPRAPDAPDAPQEACRSGDARSFQPGTGRVLGLLAVAVYGGYFNGGLGILLMALYLLVGEPRLNTVNALKNLNSFVLSVVSVITFAVGDAILWPQALWMALFATLGGFVGARLARRLPTAWVRAIVILTGLVMSGLFFGRQ